MIADALAWYHMHDHHHRGVRLSGEAMSARDIRQYADLIEQRRSIEHAIAAQNGTLEPTREKIAREVRGAALMSFALFLLRSLKG